MPYKDTLRKQEHYIVHIKEAMKVQSYFNVLSKVSSISPYYISNFALISKTERARKNYFSKTLVKLEGQNIILNEVLSKMIPFRDINSGEMEQDFQSTVYFYSGCWLNITLMRLILDNIIILCLQANSYSF